MLAGVYSLTGVDFSQKFYVFSIIWQQDSITWLIDDHEYYSDGPGPPDGTTNFPQRMFVDYVRVFQ